MAVLSWPSAHERGVKYFIDKWVTVTLWTFGPNTDPRDESEWGQSTTFPISLFPISLLPHPFPSFTTLTSPCVNTWTQCHSAITKCTWFPSNCTSKSDFNRALSYLLSYIPTVIHNPRASIHLLRKRPGDQTQNNLTLTNYMKALLSLIWETFLLCCYCSKRCEQTSFSSCSTTKSLRMDTSCARSELWLKIVVSMTSEVKQKQKTMA